MLFFKTISFYSLHQSPTLSKLPSIFTLSRKFDSLRLNSSAVGKGDESNTLVDETQQIELFKQEIVSLRERGGRAPDIELIRKHHWNDLLALKTVSARRGYYRYLLSREQTKKNGKVCE